LEEGPRRLGEVGSKDYFRDQIRHSVERRQDAKRGGWIRFRMLFCHKRIASAFDLLPNHLVFAIEWQIIAAV
ncbi:MAG: hypothetical protein AAGC68_14680, partial [Verrucomicrobiota bacterium]